MKLFRRRAPELRSVEFCEACSQVCTAQCRSDARQEHVRAWVSYQMPLPR